MCMYKTRRKDSSFGLISGVCVAQVLAQTAWSPQSRAACDTDHSLTSSSYRGSDGRFHGSVFL